MDIISLQHLCKNYGAHPVLEDVTLSVREGEIYGLVGKNGAGKTTLFKIILGLTSFDRGTLALAGGTSRAAHKRARARIGFFIGKNFFPELSARENLTYYCRMKGLRAADEVPRVLRLVGLADGRAPFSTFSMGMKQRLGIAAAMLGDPPLLLLDEPTNGLDPQGIRDMRQLLTQLNAERGTTIVVSSHILSELEHTAQRFGIIDQGRVLRELSTADLQTSATTLHFRASDGARAKRLLAAHHIDFIEEPTAARSLEEYYFDLLGGEDHA